MIATVETQIRTPQNLDSLKTEPLLDPKALSSNVVSKVYHTADKLLQTPTKYPHYTYPGQTDYFLTEPFKWTAGFFPGTLWALYERSLKHKLPVESDKLLAMAHQWTVGMKSQQFNCNTHDIGFLMMPSYARMHALTHDPEALSVLEQSAKSLVTRFSEKTQCIRSWDRQISKRVDYNDKNKYFSVIIDNMMNLDLLYYVSQHTGNQEYASIATKHADRTLDLFFRDDWSSYHVVVLDAQTGDVIRKMTHQGYDDETCWSRGQGWALYGFASCYKFTNDKKYLEASKKLADYFVHRVGPKGAVAWDFDAPDQNLLDTSAAMIACSGMLLLMELDASCKQRYWTHVVSILNYHSTQAVAPREWDSYLQHSTVNNNRFGVDCVKDTGLVYADYYFVECGNRILEQNLAI